MDLTTQLSAVKEERTGDDCVAYDIHVQCDSCQVQETSTMGEVEEWGGLTPRSLYGLWEGRRRHSRLSLEPWVPFSS